MCTRTLTRPDLQGAEEDIVVYKCVHIHYKKRFFGLFKSVHMFSSFHRKFCYYPGKVYKSYLEDFKYALLDDSYYSGQAFYSWSDQKEANVKCIIPKGSKFYKCFDCDFDGSVRIVYHSDQIKIVSVL